MLTRTVFTVAMVVALVGATGAHGDEAAQSVLAESITIVPAEIRLVHPQARQAVLVQWTRGSDVLSQAADATITSNNEGVCRIENGVAIPVADGTAELTAEVGGQKVTAKVVVSNQQVPFQWSFRNHVESVLSKQGCNGGACHGARAGQKGFRLTLFGYDLDADYSYLTRHAGGRRVVLSDPGRSLLLTKPTGLLPHKGGVRLDPSSLEYRVLAEWIASGVPGPKEGEPYVASIEVLPKESEQSTGRTQQLIVQAHYSDGSVEDVTRWAKYTSSNNSVVNVDNYGKTSVIGAGEGAVKVWYQNLNTVATIRVPFAHDIPADVYAQADRRNFIDELVLKKLTALRLAPAPACDDATFIRRLFLDAMGIVPNAEETNAFVADGAPDKRDRLIDAVLARSEFADYWAYKWSDLLLVTGARLTPTNLNAYYAAIRKAVVSNTPWDQFAREVVTATGSTVDNGFTNFYSLHQDPEDMAETVSQAFLGLSINCAKCHNHPLEKWTNDQYYGMANLFARVRAKGLAGNGDVRVVYSDIRGELLQPSRGQPQPPRPLDAPAIAFDAEADRRAVLANWLTSPENPYFARSITNRVWANYLGVGLVEKVDDLRVTNPASNEELLSELAKYLVEQKYDLKQLMRLIMRSSTYQRSSETTELNREDELYYARYYPRRLKAEVMLDAISAVTQVATEFKDKPKGIRALQLGDTFVSSYFLDTFGRPERKITCDCERSDEPSMTQVLHLLNGETINGKLKAAGGLVDKWTTSKAPPEQIVDELFVAALSRKPTAKEIAAFVATVNETPEPDRRQVLEDLTWSVLTSREFLFNH
jgi:hypothetical protein